MKRRFLVMLLAAVLLLTAAPAVFAADAAAVEVDSEEALFAAVESGAAAVRLTDDIDLHEPLLLSKSIDIDLGGRAITAYYKAFSKNYEILGDTTEDDVYIGIPEDAEGVEVSIHDGTVEGNLEARPEFDPEQLYAYTSEGVLSLEPGTAHLKNLTVISPVGLMYLSDGSVDNCGLSVVNLSVSGDVTAIKDTSMDDNGDITVHGSVEKIAGVDLGTGSIYVDGTVGEITRAKFRGIAVYTGGDVGLVDDCDLSTIHAYGTSRMPEDGQPAFDEAGMAKDGHIGTIQNSRISYERTEELDTIPAVSIMWGASVDLIKGVTLDVTGDATGAAISLDAASINGIQDTTVNGDVDLENGDIGDMDGVTINGSVTMTGGMLADTGEVAGTAHNTLGDITGSTFKGLTAINSAKVGEISGSKFNGGLTIVSSTVGDIVNCQFAAEGEYSYGITADSGCALGTIKDCTVTLTGADNSCGISIDGGTCDGIVDTTVTVSGADTVGIRLTDDCLTDNIEGCTVTVSGDLQSGGMCGIQVTGDSDVLSIDGCTVTVDAKNESGKDLFSKGVYISDSILGDLTNTTVSGAMLLEDSISGDIRGSHFDTLAIDNSAVGNTIAQNTVDQDLIVDPGSEVVSIRNNKITSRLYVCGSPEAATSVDKIIGNEAASLEISAEINTEPDASVTHIGEISGNIFICSAEDAAFINFGTIDLMEDNALKGTYTTAEGDVIDGVNMGVIKLLRADGELVKDESGLYSTFLDEGFIIINSTPGVIEKVEKPTAPKTFPDVPADAWYADAVSFASESGLMEGNEGLFNPLDAITRGEIAAVMYRLYGAEPTDGPAFTDVPAGAWYAPYVTWAAGCQLMQGGGDGTFRPTATITRAELAMVLWSAAEKPVADESVLDQYPDGASVPDWASMAMAWAVNTGLIQGTGSGDLAPAGTAQRCQVAAVLQRYVEAGYAD